MERGLNLALNLEMAEQRDLTGVQFDAVDEVRPHQLNVLFGSLENLGVVDQDLTDIPAQVVANGSNDDVTFLMDQEGGCLLFSGMLDGVPVFEQDVQIPLQLLFGLADASSPHDEPHPFGDFQAVQCFFEFGALIPFDAARNAASARIVRHQDQIAARQTDEGG